MHFCNAYNIMQVAHSALYFLKRMSHTLLKLNDIIDSVVLM